MNNSFKIFFVVIFFSLIFISCSTKDKDSNKKTTPENTYTQTESTTAKKIYPVKSGIIFYEADAMGIPTKQEYYFDDYGAKECRITKVEIEMFGTKNSSTSYEILKDGWNYKFDLDKKEGTQSKANQPIGKVSGMPDIESLTADMIQEYKYKELPSKDFFGHSCKGVSMVVMGMKMEAWLYNNILMFSNIWMGEAKEPMIMKATKYEENASLPSNIFEIPKDIKITKI